MKVLVAVDGSEEAERAFDWYFNKIHKAKNELVVVHSGQQPQLPTMHLSTDGTAFPSEEIKNIMTESNKRLAILQDKFDLKVAKSKARHKFFFQISEQSPGEKILAVAESERCDAIVMGSRGLGAIRRTILGSVSDYVIHHSKIPVLVCPRDSC